MKNFGKNRRLAVCVDRLSFGYQKKDTCFSSASFEVERGKKYILLSGEHNGKSTLIRILAGLEADYVGRVELLGEKSNHLSRAYKNIVYIPDYAVFLENKNVAKNLEYAYNVLYSETCNVDYVVRTPKTLEKVENVKVKNLSNIDRTILEFERAKLKEIKLLLLDRSIDCIEKSNKKFKNKNPNSIDEMRPLYLDLISVSESGIIACEDINDIKYFGLENAPVLYIHLGKIYQYNSLSDFYKNIKSLEDLKYLFDIKKQVALLRKDGGKWCLFLSKFSDLKSMKDAVAFNNKKRKIIDKNMKKCIKTGDIQEKYAEIEEIFYDKLPLSNYPNIKNKLLGAMTSNEEYFIFTSVGENSNLSDCLNNSSSMCFLAVTGERVVSILHLFLLIL